MVCKIIDAHLHLWERQQGVVDGRPVYPVGDGRSNFGGEVHQMMPPYMNDDRNTVERLTANMDYAGVSGCVVTQEYIDGNQDEYLLEAKTKYPERVKICSLYMDEAYLNCSEQKDVSGCGNVSIPASGSYYTDKGMVEAGNSMGKDASFDFMYRLDGFDGIKVCAGRLANKDLLKLLPMFLEAEKQGKFISIDMADGAEQTGELQELITLCPKLKIAIGHFGMVTRKGWHEQIKLARNKNVYIESGGLTWLFNYEFYPYPSAIDAINEAKGICGIEKLMWGSDYPRTMTDITYKSATRFILESDKLTDAEKAAFMGGNAEKFYGFTELKECRVIPNML